MENITSVIIHHNPDRGTSRKTMALLRNAGIEPLVIEYLKQPPDRADLTSLVFNGGLQVRDAIRQKGTPCAELALDAPIDTRR